MFAGVLGGLAVLFTSLIWIGWRFFAAPHGELHPHKEASNAASRSVSLSGAAADILDGTRDLARLAAAACRDYWHLWVPLILVGLTVLAMLRFSGFISLDPLQALEFQRERHIQSALSPEKLVPPPRLPSAMFTNTVRLGLETADRDWRHLDPEFMQLALKVFARMEARGYPMALLEGYRSPERQEMLTALGGHVTRARAFESRHQYGLALDAAPLLNGKLVISERDPWAWQAYQALGEEAERVGLIWGGRWKLRDYGHIEAPGSVEPAAKKIHTP